MAPGAVTAVVDPPPLLADPVAAPASPWSVAPNAAVAAAATAAAVAAVPINPAAAMRGGDGPPMPADAPKPGRRAPPVPPPVTMATVARRGRLPLAATAAVAVVAAAIALTARGASNVRQGVADRAVAAAAGAARGGGVHTHPNAPSRERRLRIASAPVRSLPPLGAVGRQARGRACERAGAPAGGQAQGAGRKAPPKVAPLLPCPRRLLPEGRKKMMKT